MLDHTVRSGTKLLRCGYTTGTCAALAALGAVQLLLTGEAPGQVSILTPKGVRVELRPELCRWEGQAALCGVRKDAGDDPDVTGGLLIVVKAQKTERGIEIRGGAGVGRVTKPGLDQRVGAAAINRVPRAMIRAAAEAVCAEHDYAGGLALTVSVPGGEEAAKKTFNPQLGIEGGISILGTSGIVEPMSERALVDTIALEIRQRAALGDKRLVLTPGNYGQDFIRRELPALEGLPCVKCSNYIGDALDMARLEGFEELLLVGHVGKLVKLAGGIFNTHSRVADARRELFCAHAALCGADTALCRALMEPVSTDGCLAVLEAAGLRPAVTESLLASIQAALDRRTEGAMVTGALMFSNEFGLLGLSPGAGVLLSQWEERA